MGHRHCRAHQPIEFYAGQLGMSTAQLAKICRDALGQSPSTAINAHLVREAQRDLVYSTLSVKQISQAMGFDDSAYFSRFSRKQTGSTPSEFRDAALRALRREG